MSKRNYTYINMDYLFELAEGDAAFMIEMTGDCISKMPLYMKDLEEAVASRNIPDIIFYAHKIKSSFQFMGCTEAVSLANRIETTTKADSDLQEVATHLVRLGEINRRALEELQEERVALKNEA